MEEQDKNIDRLELLKKLRGRIPAEATDLAKRQSRNFRIFWIVNGCVLFLACIIRMTSPATVMNVVSPVVMRAGSDISVTNVCNDVSRHLIDISRVSATDGVEMNARIREFDTYLRGVMMRLPAYGEGTMDLDFLTNVYALQLLTQGWCKNKNHTLKEAEKIKTSFSRYRKYFRIGRIRNVKRHPSWYVALSRVSMGITEGMLAPFCIGWRMLETVISPRKSEMRGITSAGQHSSGYKMRDLLLNAMHGKKLPASLALDSVFSPNDWRRKGPLFSLFAFYGTLVCAYGFMVLASLPKCKFLAVFAVLTLLYGMAIFMLFVLHYNNAAISWLFGQINGVFNWIDGFF